MVNKTKGVLKMKFRKLKQKYNKDGLFYFVSKIYKIIYPVFKENRKFTENELINLHGWLSDVNWCKDNEDIHKRKFFRSYLKHLSKNKKYQLNIPVECVLSRDLMKKYLVDMDKIENDYIETWMHM
jgi:hypothetical protein